MKPSSDTPAEPEWDDEWIDFYAGLHPTKLEGTPDPMVTLEFYDLDQVHAAFKAGRAARSEKQQPEKIKFDFDKRSVRCPNCNYRVKI